jgi:uncharacterized membrane protein
VLFREENFVMISQALFVLFSTLIVALAAELHCKFQEKQIAKSRTVRNLFIHYLITVFYIAFTLIGVAIFWRAYSSLNLPQLQKIVFLLFSVIILIAPILFITSWRYPRIVEKMEKWRKS